MKLTRKQRENRVQRQREIDSVARQHDMERLDSAVLIELLQAKEGHIACAATATLTARGNSAISALLNGLQHADGKVRATCALLLDHVADDTCIGPLLHALRYDPLEAVRRCAMHALVCDGCKECPLHTDVVCALLDALQNDRSLAVRRRAVFYLSQQPPDVRTTAALERLLRVETDPVLLERAAGIRNPPMLHAGS